MRYADLLLSLLSYLEPTPSVSEGARHASRRAMVPQVRVQLVPRQGSHGTALRAGDRSAGACGAVS